MPAYNPAVALIISRRRSRERAKKLKSIKQLPSKQTSIKQVSIKQVSIKQPLIEHEQAECCVIL